MCVRLTENDECMHSMYVTGTAEKLVHAKQILVCFDVVARTDYKNSALDALGTGYMFPALGTGYMFS